jgi:hypothetical protein
MSAGAGAREVIIKMETGANEGKRDLRIGDFRDQPGGW